MPNSRKTPNPRSLTYLRVAQELRERISQGIYPYNAFLPSERELALEWSASRQTVRQALEQLRQQNWVVSEHGRGNRVIWGKEPENLVSDTDPTSTKLAALVIYGMAHGGAMSIFQGAASAIQFDGFHLVVAETSQNIHRRTEDEAKHIRALIDKGIQGLIIYTEPTDQNRGLLEEALVKGIPVVQIDRYLEGLACDYVGIENALAAKEMTEHLIGVGHQRIAFLSFHYAASTCKEREQGYRDALEQHNIPFDHALVAYCNPAQDRISAITRILQQWKTLAEPPTAIFAVNDELALAVSRVLSGLPVRVPEEIAVVGFDDLPHARLISPALTTVAQPFYDLGRTAAQLLLSRMQNNFNGAPRRVLLPTRLMVRQSCRANVLLTLTR